MSVLAKHTAEVFLVHAVRLVVSELPVNIALCDMALTVNTWHAWGSQKWLIGRLQISSCFIPELNFEDKQGLYMDTLICKTFKSIPAGIGNQWKSLRIGVMDLHVRGLVTIAAEFGYIEFD